MRLPDGIAAAGGACGIKVGGVEDLGVLVGEKPLEWAGVFTRNAAAAAPVKWSRSLLGTRVRALVVNSGNANACTGIEGERAVAAAAAAAGGALGCDAGEVLVASTGVIGEQLPIAPITEALPGLIASAGPDATGFARSILTTDTKMKTAVADAGGAHLIGIAKGAAMIAPNMATMLAFIATDAAVPTGLQAALSVAVEQSFNRISVDACESTNDSVYIFSTGSVPVDDGGFVAALTGVCRSLAEQIVRDAEAGSKLVRIVIEGARDDDHGALLGRAIAASDLWRAACHGGDPNWGRVLSAAGAVDRQLDLGRFELAIGDVVLFAKGEPAPERSAAAAVMAEDAFVVRCRVGDGPAYVEVLTADLSPDYVTLNAFGTT